MRVSGKDNTTSRTLPVAADAALADVSPDVMKASWGGGSRRKGVSDGLGGEATWSSVIRDQSKF